MLDPAQCYRAVQARDTRFDGWFYTAVSTTGIYCRPSCPAATPRQANVRFFPSAAGAQQAGFRACKRCRPDASPGSPEWDTRSDVAARAVRLIADGVVDRDGVPGLAARLGYSPRQVERLLVAALGAPPVALARAQRAQTARVLIETTDLAMTDVAFAAGFSSVRQFNETTQAVFAASPSDLRRAAGRRPGGGGRAQTIVVRLPLRPPFEASSVFGHLAASVVPGVEEVPPGGDGSEATYRRTLGLPHSTGIVEMTAPSPGGQWVPARLTLGDLRDLPVAIARTRRLLDLDADPAAVDRHLSADPILAPLVAPGPGRRVPRTVDEAEMAIRVVLGQQVSQGAAATHAARLAHRLGRAVEDPAGRLLRTFPTPDQVAGAAATDLRLPGRRASAVRGLAAALASGRLDLGPGSDRDEARRRLSELAGIGPWSVEMIAMRALGDPDAFPARDLGVRRGAAAAGLPDGLDLARRAEQWKPWRSYAVQYLWGLHQPRNSRRRKEVA